MKKRYIDYLILSFVGILYTFSVIKATLITMRIPIEGWHMLLFATGVILFYYLVYTKAGRIVFLCSCAVAIGYTVYKVLINGITNISMTLAPLSRLIYVAIQVGTGYYDETISDLSLMICISVFSLFVAFPVYYFLVKKFSFYFLITPGVAFFMIVYGINRQVDKLSFYIFITVAIVSYIRHIFLSSLSKKQDSEQASRVSMFIYFVPIALLVVLFSATIPVKDYPIEWPWLDEKINKVWWDLKERYTVDRYDEFSLAKTGFGDPSRLGGPVHADNTSILLVTAPTRVYLRGAVYDEYTGSGWVLTDKSQEDYFEDRVYDQREFTYGWKAAAVELGIYNLDEFEEYLLDTNKIHNENVDQEEYIAFLRNQTKPGVLALLFPEKEITVQHLNIRTMSLFTPLKMFLPIKGLYSEAYRLNEDSEGIFMADKRLRKDSKYYFNYLQPAYGMKAMEKFLRLSEEGIYDRFNNKINLLIEKVEQEDDGYKLKQALLNVVNTYEMLGNRRDEIYQLYTNIPEQIPERVVELAKEITASHSSTYDKVKSLEDYLRKNYEYNLYTNYPPEEQDFVDYFLFDGKEGYCSYFASSLCVMTRAVGIPSRYVEGFILPKEKDRYSRYLVTNQNAHAWAEVYLEGIGWITFEATPPMAGALNYYVTLSTYDTNLAIPEYIEDFEEDSVIQNDFIPDIDGEYTVRKKITLGTILIYISVLIILMFIMNLLFMLARWIVLHIISPQKSVKLLYRYTVSLLKQAGSNMEIGQTPMDYARAVDERYTFSKYDMCTMVKIYYSVRFGSHDIDKEKLKSVFSFVSEVKANTGRSMYLLKRVLYRCLLFKG